MDKSSKLRDSIAVTVDKSHLVTLGERLYVEAVELFRELVSNAYDADASEVRINLDKDKIAVADDGSGMNRRGLEQFFNIGSAFKRQEAVSPHFGRKRIGQFGIGKFAVLTAADVFEVITRKGGNVYRVIFNKEDWQNQDSWQLPIDTEPADAFSQTGTKVIISKLKKTFSASEIERFIREVMPLRAKKFSVFVNGSQVRPEETIGRRFPFAVKTMFGSIEGVVILADNRANVRQPGLECRVAGVLIKRSLFDIDARRHGVGRLAGWVEAPFLPLTSGRSEFVQDSPEYKIFIRVVKAQLEEVLQNVGQEEDKRQLAKMRFLLKGVLDMLRQALKENPDLAPSARVLARRRQLSKRAQKQALESAAIKEKSERAASEENEKPPQSSHPQEEPLAPLPEATYERKFRVAKLGVTCGFAHLGEKGPEVMSQRTVIYINQDHPLYRKIYSKKELLSFHLLRLITQEVVIMKKLRLPAREAFALQSRLLRDALT